MGASIPPQGGQPQPDIPALSAEMAAWLKRGGSIDPHSSLASAGIHLPNGALVGGEFSDEELAAYMDAYRKLEAMKLQAKMAPQIAAMTSAGKAPADATAARVIPLTRKAPPVNLTPVK